MTIARSLLAGLCAALALATLGCGPADRPPPPEFSNAEADGGLDEEADAELDEQELPATPKDAGKPKGCKDGASRKCTIVLNEHSGVKTCFTFDQWCVDGEWGACGEPNPYDLPELE